MVSIEGVNKCDANHSLFNRSYGFGGTLKQVRIFY